LADDDPPKKMRVLDMAKLRFRKVVKNRAIAYELSVPKEDKLLINAVEHFSYGEQGSERLSDFDLKISFEGSTVRYMKYLLYKFSGFIYKDVGKDNVERVAELIKERYKELQKEEEYVFDF